MAPTNAQALMLAEAMAAGGGGFSSPHDLTGLILWWDANVGVSTSAGKITGISDQSGAGNNSTGFVGFNQPTFSSTGFDGTRPAFTYNIATVAGGSVCNPFPMGTGNTLTIWHVAKMTNSANSNYTDARTMAYAAPSTQDFNSTQSWALARGGSDSLLQISRNSVGQNLSCTITTAHIAIVTIDPSGNIAGYINGTKTSLGTAVGGNWASAGVFAMGISAPSAGNLGFDNGVIGEVGVATGWHNDTICASLYSYLKSKWGL